MDNSGEIIHLYRTDNFITEDPSDAFKVVSGSVFVFIAPLKNGRPDRRVSFRRVEAGHLIPSFSFRDAEYVNWRFILVPSEEADLLKLPGSSTRVLQRRFVEAAGLENFQQEGFSQSLIDHYKRETLEDVIVIDLSDRNESGMTKASHDVIKQAFSDPEQRVEGNNALYRAMAFACRESNIPFIDPDKALSVCGNDYTAPSLARAARFGCRRVVLDPGWFGRDSGTVIGFLDGKPVACVPKGQGSYTIFYGEDGQKRRLTQSIAETIDPKAFVICRTLPGKPLSLKDLFQFGMKSIRRIDLVYVLVLSLVGSLIGILLPSLNQKIYDEYIPLGNYSQLIQICVVIATFMIGSLFFDMVKKLSEFRISSHIGYDLQNAVYYRVFHLPESFFRTHESADLAQRLSYISGLANSFTTAILLAGIGSLFSFLYLYKMFTYSGKLSWIAMLLLAVYSLVLYLMSKATLKYDKRIEKNKGDASAKLYQFLNGIEKIRMAGVEDRAAYEYLLPFAEKQTFEISKNRLMAYRAILSGSASVLFSMVFYLIIVKSKIQLSTGAFMAFNSAFGAFSASLLSLIDGALNMYQLKPQFERIKPVLETAPEDDGEKEVPGKLSGEVSFNNVWFSYEKNGHYVLNGIDLKIKPGEYLGIVGSSGCGKSTLLKLLLGFETPDQGQVCFDGKNLAQLDKREVRKNLGVVLQNGKLIAGSIYENITITAPSATMKDVQSVIDAVGLKSDIEQMPMGVHTVLSENSGTISGGQQQRILIARAIISHPAILVFDEATSALDNVTQAAVCESLDKMNVTRIVVAHRLSTIKNCDRIVVMQAGKIVEQGNYDTLMKQNGLFYQLAVRQLVD